MRSHAAARLPGRGGCCWAVARIATAGTLCPLPCFNLLSICLPQHCRCSAWRDHHQRLTILAPPLTSDLRLHLATQLLQVLSVILITIAGTLFVERGTIVTVFIIVYALTSFVGG